MEKACAWDDVSGSGLDPVLDLKARQEETAQFKQHQAYEKVKEEVCLAITGKTLIGSRWIGGLTEEMSLIPSSISTSGPAD